MRNTLFVVVSVLLLTLCLTSVQAGDVAIYTGNVGWIDPGLANTQSQTCADTLISAGITNVTRYTLNSDGDALATWVSSHTGNGKMDVLVLYGWFPPTIYPQGNALPEGSIAEAFIESTDGDMILNHADYMFYVTGNDQGNCNPCNEAPGLQNMMDLPTISMWPVDPPPTQVTVTALGTAISPSLVADHSWRPFHINELQGDWYVEASLAQNADGTQADPVIVRDGPRGRLAIAYQNYDDAGAPRGVVAADMIKFLMQRQATQIAVYGAGATVTGTPVQYKVFLADDLGEAPQGTPVTVNLTSSAPTGRFDTTRKGSFNGTVTSVTIPANQGSVSFYYKDTVAALVTLTVAPAGLPAVDKQVNVLQQNPAVTKGEVAIFTGNTGWVDKAAADAQAQICVDKLNLMTITNRWFSAEDTATLDELANWVSTRTGNNKLDVLVLYGSCPVTLYPSPNTLPDNSIAEAFIESTDGDTIINHADYMFYIGDDNPRAENGPLGLEYMMDITGVTMWNYGWVSVTPDGADISKSLAEYQKQGNGRYFLTERGIYFTQLVNDWFVEVALAQDFTGNRMEPVIMRDGNRGRLIPIFQAPLRADPKGAVAAEVIAWLNGITLDTPTKLGVLGKNLVYKDRPLKLSVQIQNFINGPVPTAAARTVNLTSSAAATGRFDISQDGSFDGTVTSVTVPAGETGATFFYKDTAAGTPTVTAASTGLTSGTRRLTVIARTFAPPGDVAIYTGTVAGIDKGLADEQAQICKGRLDGVGVTTTLFPNATDPDLNALANWVTAHTGNNKLDVLILNGVLPPTLYPSNNGLPEGSIAEGFVDTFDGDAIINHADWMFYVSDPNCRDVAGPCGLNLDNWGGGLQNIMDIPTISMAGGDNPMTVTAEGRAIAPSLGDFLTDRPFHVEELLGDWMVEASLAQNADGTLADPIIVRNGDLGRLIPCFQTFGQNDPKGAVAAEIIAWLFGKGAFGPTKLGLASGESAALPGRPTPLTVTIQDAGGVSYPATSAVTVNLAKDSATGAFDLTKSGPFNGSVTSVTIPVGQPSAAFYYKDTAAKLVTLTATATGLNPGTLQVNVLVDKAVGKGDVAIYTINTGWIDKAVADSESQTCSDLLTAESITVRRFVTAGEETELADWVTTRTNNGKLDVLVLYGWFPNEIYPAGNALPNGSVAEAFIESTDGDVIMNHADWMFYVSGDATGLKLNQAGGLQNMMDIPTITMGPDNTAMTVTAEGSAIAPTLANFASWRPFHVNELAGNWLVEAVLAQDAAGTHADPIIVRDGNLGRLIPVFQVPPEQPANPRGVVGAEIILWLMSRTGAATVKVWTGNANGDNTVNIADAVTILGYLFGKPPKPAIPCFKAADTNDDDTLNVADAIDVLTFLFGAQTNPSKPMTGPDGSSIGTAACRPYPAATVPALIIGQPGCATPCP